MTSKPLVINKTMDFNDLLSPEAEVIGNELNNLILELKSKNLKISSWYGVFDLHGNKNSFEYKNRGYDYKPLPNSVDDVNFPWFLYWEIVWVILNNNYLSNQKLLDLGGSSSLFSYYVASKGLEIITIDLNKELVDNANYVAAKMNWNLTNYEMNMENIDFKEDFDHITSICVFEHIPMYSRVKINRKIKQILKQDGTFSITFDYKNPSKEAQINIPEDIYSQFVEPSELKIRKNTRFYDNNINYLLHPFFHEPQIKKFKEDGIRLGHFDKEDYAKTKKINDYTFGALFMEK